MSEDRLNGFREWKKKALSKRVALGFAGIFAEKEQSSAKAE